MVKRTAIFVVFLISAVYPAPIPDDLILTLPNGKIQGATYVTGNNVTYYGFRGIPYATPPLGDLRLEVPQPSKPWSGVWDATKDSKICISASYLKQPQLESEDCLYINVYVPTLQPKEKLPVMVWIYGGAFTRGEANKDLYGPDFLVEKDVIIVSFNYRVGPLGFISTGDKNLPGNLGLKDQNLALRWTRQNIEYFGGEPQKITIFGESAGGASVGLHLVSKQSAGLFRAAIVESGSALTYWALNENPQYTAYSIANGIPGGNYGNDSQKLKEFLKNRTVEEIMTATKASPIRALTWPTLEVESENAFLTESSYELLAAGKFNQVPIMIGICAEESLMFIKTLEHAKEYALLIDIFQSQTIPPGMFPNKTDESRVIKQIRSIYLKEEESFSSNLVAFADYLTDNAFARGIIKHAELTSIYAPVYLYQFAYFGRPITQPFIDGAEKASHGGELPFLFFADEYSNTTDPGDLLTESRMVTLWTNFAKYLNPTPEKSELFGNVIWPVLNNQSSPYLNINNTLEVKFNLKGNSYSKWDNIFQTYGKKPFRTY